MSGGPLTWRNVDAPSFSGGNDAFRTAALLLGRAATPVQEALTSFQNEERLRQSALAQTNVMTSANPMTALQSGTALAGIDPGMLSQEAITNMGMEAQRRANVGNTLASTANTRATTDRTVQLTPGMVTAQGLENDFNRQANPIKIGASQTSLDAAKLSLQEASELNTINDNARKTYQELAQNGSLTTAEGRDNAIRLLESRGLDPRITSGVKTMIGGASAPVVGNADALTLGQPPLGSAAEVAVNNPFNQGGANPVALATGLIKQKEGYDPNGRGGTPYWDVNAYRGGYGSDTLTNPVTGEYRRVMPGDKITPQMAEADLARRIGDFQAQAAKEAPGFEKLPATAQAALTSVIYNYGSLKELPGLRQAIASGDTGAIANQVRALKDHNNGVNASRRIEEANIIAGKSTISGDAGRGSTGLPNVASGPAPQAYNPVTTPPSNDPIQLLQQTKDLNNQAQALLDQNRVRSNLYDTDASIAKALAAPNEGKSQSQVIDDLVKQGADAKEPNSIWSDTARNKVGITNAMNYLQETYGLAPNAAGAFIANSIGTENKFFSPDYQTVDTSKLDSYVGKFIDKDSKKPNEAILNKGIALVNGDKQDQIIQQRVELYNNVSAVQRNELANLIESRKTNSGAGLEAAIDKKKAELAQTLKSIQTDLKKIKSSSDMSDKARQRQ